MHLYHHFPQEVTRPLLSMFLPLSHLQEVPRPIHLLEVPHPSSHQLLPLVQVPLPLHFLSEVLSMFLPLVPLPFHHSGLGVPHQL